MNPIMLVNTLSPITVIIMSLILLLLYLNSDIKDTKKLIAQNIFIFFVCSLGNWIITFLNITNSKWFILLNPISVLTVILVHVFFYKFIFLLTRIDVNKKFSKAHFIFLAVYFVLFLIYNSGMGEIPRL